MYLLVQAMAKLQEPSQVVQCREEDVKVVEGAMPKAQALFKTKFGKEAPQLTLDRTHFLAKGAATAEQEDDPDHPTWYGAACNGGACAAADADVSCRTCPCTLLAA